MMNSRSLALLLSPIGLLLISATRLLIISDYNTTTATTIASSGGFVNTLLGTIIPLVPTFIPYIALILLLYGRFILSIIAFLSAAFISPTPLTVPVTLPLARADEHYTANLITGHMLIAVLIGLAIVGAAAHYHRSFTEAMATLGAIIIAFALLFTVTIRHLPTRLRLAGNSDSHIVKVVTGNLTLAGLLVLGFIVIILIYHSSFNRAFIGMIAIAATIALFPYVWYIFPVPHHSGYYAAVIHQPWLPAEKVTLSTGRIYYGYVLVSDPDWVTMLIARNRTIRYIPADDVIGRKVCQPKLANQPAPNPPLIPLLYKPPAPIPPCPDRDRSTTRTSILSHGQSLRAISFAVHVPPKQIISTTNDYQHLRLSTALSTYESLHDWNAPTPVGQRFWYYRPVRP
jgi:hypothetical protein